MVYKNMSSELEAQLMVSQWMSQEELFQIAKHIRSLIYHDDQIKIRMYLDKISGAQIVSSTERFPSSKYYFNLNTEYMVAVLNGIYDRTMNRINETEKQIEENRSHYMWQILELIRITTHKNIGINNKEKVNEAGTAPQGFSRKTFEEYYQLQWDN